MCLANNIVLPTAVPATKYTNRTKKPHQTTRLNAMNVWTDEGRMCFQKLFPEVIQDWAFYGRSFNRPFAAVLPLVTRKYAATTKTNKQKMKPTSNSN